MAKALGAKALQDLKKWATGLADAAPAEAIPWDIEECEVATAHALAENTAKSTFHVPVKFSTGHT